MLIVILMIILIRMKTKKLSPALLIYASHYYHSNFVVFLLLLLLIFQSQRELEWLIQQLTQISILFLISLSSIALDKQLHIAAHLKKDKENANSNDFLLKNENNNKNLNGIERKERHTQSHPCLLRICLEHMQIFESFFFAAFKVNPA